MLKYPAVSVLIPAYNEEEFLAGTIDSIRQSFSAVGESSYEIIVCDNNSNDATAEIARSKGVHVVFEPHHQIAKARNAAARVAKGEWLIFLDADTWLNVEILRKTLQYLRSGNVLGGGAKVMFDEVKLPWATWLLIAAWNKISVIFELAAGSYLYCSQKAWSEVGGFNEHVYVSEEIWFSKRLKAWGQKHGMKFKIITETPIVTSSRKLKWYTTWQITKQMFILLIPWTTTRKQHCAYWYTRPQQKNVEVVSKL